MNTPELNRFVKDKKTAALIALGSAAALAACSAPATPAPEAASVSNPNADRKITKPVIAGSQSAESQRLDLNTRKLSISESGVVTDVLDQSTIFPEGRVNSEAYFCKEAPKSQKELRAQLTDNKLVRERLLAMGLNPSSARFLSDQPLPISETQARYIEAGLSKAEAEKLANPTAQMSPYQVGGKVVLASVNFTGGEQVRQNPAQFERTQGLYNEQQRLVWPVVFDKVLTMDQMIPVGGFTHNGMQMGIMLPAEVAAAVYGDEESGAANIDAICCQPLTPGKPTPPRDRVTPEPTTPPEEEEEPTPEPTATPTQPVPPTTPPPKVVPPTATSTSVPTEVPTPDATPTDTPPRESEPTPTDTPGRTPEPTPTNTAVPPTPTKVPLQPEGQPTPTQPAHTATPIAPSTPAVTNTPVRQGTPSPTPETPVTPTRVPLQPTGQPTPTTRPDGATATPITPRTPSATNTPVRGNPTERPTLAPTSAPTAEPTRVPLQPTGQPTPVPVEATRAPIAPSTPVVVNTPVRQATSAPAAPTAPTTSNPPAAPTPFR